MMPHTAVIPAMALWRTAGPVSITRAAMRPAKSFWKNGQLCRTTCKWLCQRTRLVMPATMPALLIMLWQAIASGRPTSRTATMAASRPAWSPSTCGPVAVVIRRMRRPMNQGTDESSSATQSPAAKRATNRLFA